jgi:hypothetical protein
MALSHINPDSIMTPISSLLILRMCLLPDSLKRPYILKEFPEATFGAINAYQDPGSTTARVVVQMKSAGFAEPVLQAEGNSLYVIPSGAAGAAAVAVKILLQAKWLRSPLQRRSSKKPNRLRGRLS